MHDEGSLARRVVIFCVAVELSMKKPPVDVFCRNNMSQLLRLCQKSLCHFKNILGLLTPHVVQVGLYKSF